MGEILIFFFYNNFTRVSGFWAIKTLFRKIEHFKIIYSHLILIYFIFLVTLLKAFSHFCCGTFNKINCHWRNRKTILFPRNIFETKKFILRQKKNLSWDQNQKWEKLDVICGVNGQVLARERNFWFKIGEKHSQSSSEKLPRMEEVN